MGHGLREIAEELVCLLCFCFEYWNLHRLLRAALRRGLGLRPELLLPLGGRILHSLVRYYLMNVSIRLLLRRVARWPCKWIEASVEALAGRSGATHLLRLIWIFQVLHY